MPIFPPPFGPLNPLHNYILATARPYTLATIPWVVAPHAVLWLQGYLLLGPAVGTARDQWARGVLGVLGVVLTARVWTGWRFVEPENNILNILGSYWWYVALKAVEWGLVTTPFVHDYMVTGSRSRAFSALDLVFNARMVGVSAVEGKEGMSEAHGREATRATQKSGSQTGQRGDKYSGSKANRRPQRPGRARRESQHATTPSAHPPPPYPHPGYPPAPPCPRLPRIIHHLTQLVVHALIHDVFLGIGRAVGTPDGLNRIGGRPGMLRYFSTHTQFVVSIPTGLGHGGGGLNWTEWALPPALIRLAMIPIVGLCGHAVLSIIYHTFMAVCLMVGWPAVASPPLLNQPWRADSLNDLWARRWHQMLRRQWTFLAHLLESHLHLRPRALLLPVAFTTSALMHAVGFLAASPVPVASGSIYFFLLMGCACCAEALFARLTGYRVRGPWGRVWTWTVMCSAAPLIAATWLDSGFAACPPVPLDLGPGRWVGRLVRWVVDVRQVESGLTGM